MNNAQLTGIRMLHSETSSVVRRSMTAREMALTPHNLSKAGDMATLEDGSVFVWDGRFEKWSLWKIGR